MKENSPVSQLGNFDDRPWGVSEIGGRAGNGETIICEDDNGWYWEPA